MNEKRYECEQSAFCLDEICNHLHYYNDWITALDLTAIVVLHPQYNLGRMHGSINGNMFSFHACLHACLYYWSRPPTNNGASERALVTACWSAA